MKDILMNGDINVWDLFIPFIKRGISGLEKLVITMEAHTALFGGDVLQVSRHR